MSLIDIQLDNGMDLSIETYTALEALERHVQLVDGDVITVDQVRVQVRETRVRPATHPSLRSTLWRPSLSNPLACSTCCAVSRLYAFLPLACKCVSSPSFSHHLTLLPSQKRHTLAPSLVRRSRK